MATPLTPPRRRGVEYLDEPGVDPGIVRRSLADVARANALFGGTHAVLAELTPALDRLDCTDAGGANGAAAGSVRGLATLLDVGAGAGDIPREALTVAARRGVRLTTIGLDSAEPLVGMVRDGGSIPVAGDALDLPFADRSVDIVICSQLLHHFVGDDLIAAVRELDRVARRRVIVSDLRRSYVAAAGLWLASFPLDFHPVSRHDGVVSVMRGFTTAELRDIVLRATGKDVVVSRRAGFRVTASWDPTE